MPYIYPDVDNLEETPKVGSKQCVALLQHYSDLPNTHLWKEGQSVLESPSVAKGTAIATFVDGKYKSLVTGNHAAYFISKDATGIWIMDQWFSDEKKPFVSKRHLRRKGKLKNGNYVDPSNNADAYSIIE